MDDSTLRRLQEKRVGNADRARRLMRQAAQDFDRQARRAEDAGLVLEQRGNGIYTLSSPAAGWETHLYPGSQVIREGNQRRPPHLRLERPWGLGDAVTAAIVATRTKPSED